MFAVYLAAQIAEVSHGIKFVHWLISLPSPFCCSVGPQTYFHSGCVELSDCWLFLCYNTHYDSFSPPSSLERTEVAVDVGLCNEGIATLAGSQS